METTTTIREAAIPGCPGYSLTEDGRVWNPWKQTYIKPYHDKSKNCDIVEMVVGGVKKRFRLHVLHQSLFGDPAETIPYYGTAKVPTKKGLFPGFDPAALTQQGIRDYVNNELKKRGLLTRYHFNNSTTKTTIIKAFDEGSSVDGCDKLVAVVFDVPEHRYAETRMLAKHYKKRLTSLRFITEPILDDLMAETRETMEIIEEFPKHNDTVRKILYKGAQRRSVEMGIPIGIHIEDIFLTRLCPYLGTPMIYGATVASGDSASLDKIIPALGYVKGNIQVISSRANLMKSNSSVEQMVAFANSVLKLHI